MRSGRNGSARRVVVAVVVATVVVVAAGTIAPLVRLAGRVAPARGPCVDAASRRGDRGDRFGF
eukprot:3765046-Pyramimonas_sp.AAC.1